MNRPYTRDEAAMLLGLSVETLDKYRRLKKMPHHKVGDRVLYTEGDISLFLEACAVPATETLSGKERQNMAKRAGGADEDPS
jgi:excisionase family DNA binding protein